MRQIVTDHNIQKYKISIILNFNIFTCNKSNGRAELMIKSSNNHSHKKWAKDGDKQKEKND